ncbi:MAG: iron chelate uptake ABC transporter family permease subunit [Prevotella sp.]
MKRFHPLLILLLMAVTIVLFVANLLIGTVNIPLQAVVGIIGDIPMLLKDFTEGEQIIWRNIIMSSRLPQTVTALLAGAGLAVSGLQMQTVFRNPLAGPSVLGVSNGASLGVAFVVLLSSSLGGVALSRLGYMGDVAITIAAIIGAIAVLALIIIVAQHVKGNVTLLLIGVMTGYLANAIIGVLKFFSPEEDVKAYVVWGLGCFSRTSGTQLLVFTILMCVLLPLSMLLIKTMNLLLLGDNYARNLGLDIRRSRMAVIVSSGLLAAVVTAYCGPIMFIGLAVPHLARALFRTSDHRLLLPSTMVAGAALALICNILARLPGFEGALPVNSVTALVGAPIIATVLLRKKS